MTGFNTLQRPRLAGPTGRSAYESAVVTGYAGTEEDWVASLHGKDGQDADPTALNAATSAAQGSAEDADASALDAAESAQAAGASASAAAGSATTAGLAVSAAGDKVTLAAAQANASAISAANSAGSATLAQNWAMQTSGTVDGSSYSSKWYAQLAANWASQATGTVDGTSLSAKQYAQQAAQSAAQAAGAGITPQGSFAVGDLIVAGDVHGSTAKSLGQPAKIATSGSASDLTTGTLPSAQLPTHGVANSNLAQMPAGTVKANLTGALADAADVTPSTLLGSFSTTRGSILFCGASAAWSALGPGAAGQVLISGGAGADPAWGAVPAGPSAVNAQSVSYIAIAADKGKVLELSGDGQTLTLGPGTAVAGWYAYIRKRDGSGKWVISPASGTIDALASIALYQESYLVWFDGTNYRTQGRPRGPLTIGTTTIAASVPSVVFTTGFGDVELDDMDFEFQGLTAAAAGNFTAKVGKGGTYSTSYNGAVSLLGGSNVSNLTLTTAVSMSRSTAAGAIQGKLVLQGVNSATTNMPVVGVTALEVGQNPVFGWMAETGSAAASSGVSIQNTGGNLTAGTIVQRGYRR